MSTKDRVLVYSDDPKDRNLLDGSAAKAALQAKQKEILLSNQFTVVFRIEKNGRGGKTVTVIDQLPADEPFLKDLTKEFKVKCGVGGTFTITGEIGQIEIQGDNREKMKKILEAKKIKFKGM